MSRRRQNIAIGAFVAGAAVLVFLFLVYMKDADFGGGGEEVVMVFEGSVKGLSPGAPVALRGVQIGQVTEINLRVDSDTMDIIMLVEAELQTGRIVGPGDAGGHLIEGLVERGMRAELNTQSLLTGLLYIQLDFQSAGQAYLADIETDKIQIPTVPNELERLTREIESIEFDRLIAGVQRLLTGLEELVAGEEFQQLPGELNATLSSVRGLSEELRATVASSGPRLELALDKAAVVFEQTGTALPELSASLQQDLEAVRGAAERFEESMSRVQSLAGPDSEALYNFNRAMAEVAEAARALKLLARNIEERPETLLRGRRGEE